MSKDMNVSCDITESETEVIEVEDDPESPRKQVKDLGSATEGNLREKTKLCEFPAASTNSVIVCFADYMTLKPGTFLNDIMIDFYLTYIYHNLLSITNKPTVHIFSTMFYKRLVSPPTNTKTMPSYESDPCLIEVEKQHRRVKGWTKNCNLFEKNLLVIPICESSHWYLLVVVRPGCIKVGCVRISSQH